MAGLQFARLHCCTQGVVTSVLATWVLLRDKGEQSCMSCVTGQSVGEMLSTD